MRLYIAEKPSLGMTIAKVLGIKPGRRNGYVETKDGYVTWCVGHILEMANPEHYWPEMKGERWSLEPLPMVPQQWAKLPVKSKQKQLNIIGKLLGRKEVTEIVHAGDAGREGQIIVDEVLEHHNNTKPVLRFWTTGLDRQNIEKALASMEDNARFQPYSEEAKARAEADWLIGMNMSRVTSIKYAKYGEILSVGRVQTPTLAIIVGREREIQQFKPKTWYAIVGTFEHPNGRFEATWQPEKSAYKQGVDAEGYLVDRQQAEKIKQALAKHTGSISAFDEKTHKVPPPLPMVLSTLLAKVNKRDKVDIDKIQAAAQRLYEAGAMTYPRTDCEYLPESQHGDAPGVIETAVRALAIAPEKTATLDRTLKSRAWNDKKITEDHHGLMPTVQAPAFKGELERTVYDYVARYYLAQFYPAAEDFKRRCQVGLKGETFAASGTTELVPGWRVLFSGDKDTGDKDKGDHTLPAMQVDDAVTCVDMRLEERQTKPPARFTQGTLVDKAGGAMASVAKFVTDPALKKLLKETAGLGTPATRTEIVKKLFARKFIKSGAGKAKHHILPTEPGYRLVDHVLPELKDPGLTALFEQELERIKQGKSTRQAFIEKQVAFLERVIAKEKAA